MHNNLAALHCNLFLKFLCGSIHSLGNIVTLGKTAETELVSAPAKHHKSD